MNKITGTISASDLLNAQRLHREKTVRWLYAGGGIVAVVGVGLLGLENKMFALVLIGGGLGAVIGELITSAIVLPKKVRRMYRQLKDLSSPFTYSWDAEFLEAQGRSGHSKREWRNYVKFKENEKLFLLYHADNIFEMLPKSWFQDQAQVADFRSHARRAGEA